MYFDTSKKNYYRFPSINSVNEMDSKYYFPEKLYSSGENSHPQSSSGRQNDVRSHYASIK